MGYDLYMSGLGIASRGRSLVELDRLASEQGAPHGIITVDCSDPHEIDDGIHVEALPTVDEIYKIRVFAVDTSELYQDQSITRDVIARTESRYRNLHTSVEEYDPMLEEDIVRSLHFESGKTKNALVVSYLVGKDLAPRDQEISFGRVQVVENLRYDNFGTRCRSGQQFEYFARAAAFILHHLAPSSIANPELAFKGLTENWNHRPFKTGADINQIFMVCSNFLVAQLINDQDLGIFRVHDPLDDTHAEIMSPKLARFSSKPGPHRGLGLERYTRVTSPLRRAEDFIMHGLLRARYDNPEYKYTSRDRKNVAATIQKLNQRIVSALFDGNLSMREDDFWVPPSVTGETSLQAPGSGFASRLLGLPS